MQQKIPGIRYEIGLYSKRIGVFGGLSATNQQSSQSYFILDVINHATVSLEQASLQECRLANEIE
jgi:hypothetical protein